MKTIAAYASLALGLALLVGMPTLSVAQDYAPANKPAKGAKPTTPGSGPAGPAAADAGQGMSMLAARVASTGTITTGSGTTGASKLGTGAYEVDFERDVSACFYSASPFSSGQTVTTVEPRSGNPNGVFLQIQKLDGTANTIDGTFYLLVFCPN